MYTFEATDHWQLHDSGNEALNSLVGDAHSGGNLLRHINDFRHDPVNNPHGSTLDGEENVMFCEVTHKGWPYVFVVTTTHVTGGQEVGLVGGRVCSGPRWDAACT
eukprot:m.388068 g.388068  ORF g.388068 m.388068 type:complete len:105 (-) comp20067_c0_seq12:34-348(-)